MAAAIVQHVVNGAPADKAGIKTGDSIVAANGKPINSSDSLVAQVRAMAIGDQVTLTVMRGGHAHNIRVTLSSQSSAK